MVLLDPPAPAERVDEGRGMAGARRLRCRRGRARDDRVYRRVIRVLKAPKFGRGWTRQVGARANLG